MIKKKFLIFSLIFIFINNCSFDNKTGIWGGSKREKDRIARLEKQQKEIIDIQKIYSSDYDFSIEVPLKKKIKLSNPKKNKSWHMSGLNHQNSLGNVYLPGIDKTFLKKKTGKNKFSISKIIASPLIYEKKIIFSNDRGTIYNINNNGKILWKKNIYRKLYKKIHKSLNFSIYNNNIFVVDNVGFIYSISLDTGDLVWIKNHGTPIKSKIKIFENKIFIINQDNRLLCLNTKDGSKIWDVRSISSFIKSQNFLSIAVTKQGDVVSINSSGDLMKINGYNGRLYWSLNTSTSLLIDSTDFFKSSEVVIEENDIFFSTGTTMFSFNLNDGRLNWEQNISTIGTPIISGGNIFLVTDNGFLAILDKNTGEVISSKNILKILKKRKQNTKITGFIMGSGKIYSTTLNGYLIVSSASTGNVEYAKKIGDSIISSPIINNGNLYILTNDSRIFGMSQS